MADFINSALSWLGAEQQNRRQADAAETANAFSAQQFATRYQTTTKDMQAAGLNPMLAYSQGGGSPPTGQQANVPANSGAAAGSAYLAAKMNDAQVDATTASAEASRAAAEASSAEAARTRALTPGAAENQGADTRLKGTTAELNHKQLEQIDATVRKITAETANIPIEGRRLEAVIINLQAQNNLLGKQAISEVERAAQLKNMASKLLKENHLLNLDIEAADFSDNFGRRANEFREALDVVKDLIPSRAIDRLLGGGKAAPRAPRTTKSNSTTYGMDGEVTGGRSSTSTTE